jgi:valyl-tRNA synthetase
VLDFKAEEEKKLGKGIEGLGEEKYHGVWGSTIFHNTKEKLELAHKVLLKSVEGSEEYTQDSYILTRLGEVTYIVKEGIEKYRFNDAAEALYEFYWHEFCDKYIEYAKDKRETTQPILEFVLKSCMELMHPFMPFITEEVWQKLPHQGKSISVVE